MAKIWQKDYDLDRLMEEFTVGSDRSLDLELVPADVAGSAAHAEMLAKIGVLKSGEAEKLRDGLVGVLDKWENGSFTVADGEEDCHTAIERYLIELFGETGKRIHTGRSRNDQIQTALRLYGRDGLSFLLLSAAGLAETILDFAEKHAGLPMPGRTHMQLAMPSTVGLWAASLAEELTDEIGYGWALYAIVNRNPLGSAASYGVPLPLDREMTAGLLGFGSVQNNVLYANNSRGKFEAMTADLIEYFMLSFSKFAQDLLLFSLPEIGYFSLPRQLCTGSSIMPQKKNPDGLELLRSRAAVAGGYAAAIKGIIRSLPSGYNRDFQDTKEPFMKCMQTLKGAIAVVKLLFENLQVNAERLTSGFTPDIFATDIAIERVRAGESFRDAYGYVAAHIDDLGKRDPRSAIALRSYAGSPGNLNLDAVRDHMRRLRESISAERKRAAEAVRNLLGRDVSFFR